MSVKVLIERRTEDFIKKYPEFRKEKINKQFLFFTVFSLSKDSRISYEDILDGIVDGSEDYGIDGIFVFSSGQLIDEEEELSTQITKEDKVKIQLLQVTRDPGFSETVLLKLKNGIEKTFDLENKIKGNENFSRKVRLIRNVWVHCFDLGNTRNIEVELIYVSLSTTEKIAKKIKILGEDIYKYLKKQELRNTTIKYIGIPANV